MRTFSNTSNILFLATFPEATSDNVIDSIASYTSFEALSNNVAYLSSNNANCLSVIIFLICFYCDIWCPFLDTESFVFCLQITHLFTVQIVLQVNIIKSNYYITWRDMNQQTTIPSTKQASGNIELVWKILQNIPTEKLFGIDLQATGLIDGDPREAGYDTSVFQGIVNHDIMKLYGYNFWYGRMGISWGYVDPTFAINWEKAGIAGLYRSSYHVIYTNQPIKSQFDNWIKHHPKIDKVPRIIDLEVDTGDTYTNKANAVKSM